MRWFKIVALIVLLFQAQAVAQESILDHVKKFKPEEWYKNEKSVVLLLRTRVNVSETGYSERTEETLVKILKIDAISGYSVLRFNFNPVSQKVKVEEIKILRKGNGKFSEIGIDVNKMCRVVPKPQRWIYWGHKMIVCEVSPLRKGDFLYYRVSKVGFEIALLGDGDKGKYEPPMKGSFYDIVLFEHKEPVIEQKYELTLPLSKELQYMVVNGEVGVVHKISDKHHHYIFFKKNIKPFMYEKLMAAKNDVLTKLVLTTVKTWEEKSRWFYRANEWVFKDNKEIKEKVKEIIKGKAKDIDKVYALLRWVARHIRYSGISMGEKEGYTIHPGVMTFRDRCGVCKDIAGMLITMMRSAGFETYAAMTMAGERVEDIPADQFNHCVVAWKRKDGSFVMLDPTWAPFSRFLWSKAEGEQHYLIGTKKGEKLRMIPAFKSSENVFNLVVNTKIDKNGNLKSKLVLKSKGYAETRIRRVIIYRHKKGYKDFFLRLLSKISKFVRISGIKIFNLYNLDRDLLVKINYSVPGYALRYSKGIFFTPPLAKPILAVKRWAEYLNLKNLDKRKYPVFIWYPQKVVLQEKVVLPSNFKIKNKSVLKKFEGKYVTFLFKTKKRKNVLHFFAEWEIKKRLIPKQGILELRELIKVVNEFKKLKIHAHF